MALRNGQGQRKKYLTLELSSISNPVQDICAIVSEFQFAKIGAQRLPLLSATTRGDGFTHNLAMSLPVRHNVAQSRSRVLASGMSVCVAAFSPTPVPLCAKKEPPYG